MVCGLWYAAYGMRPMVCGLWYAAGGPMGQEGQDQEGQDLDGDAPKDEDRAHGGADDADEDEDDRLAEGRPVQRLTDETGNEKTDIKTASKWRHAGETPVGHVKSARHSADTTTDATTDATTRLAQRPTQRTRNRQDGRQDGRRYDRRNTPW